MKKVLIIFLIFNVLFQGITLANDYEEDLIWSESESVEENNLFKEPNISSRHCICIERSTEQVLFEKDAYTKCAIASTTKILTGIIIIENCDLEDEVLISKKAANTGGSTLGIREGAEIKVETLLYGLLLRSGNDAAVALAEYLSGSVEEFAKLMNNKAKEIGLKNSNFVTPHGLDDENHFSTAYDLAILSNYALKNEVFLKIVGTKQIDVTVGISNRVLNNTNELLGNVEGIYGIKTGFTSNAGRCLITACERNGIDIIIVVLGADTKNIRGNDTKKIIKYVFDNFEMVDTKEEIERIFIYMKNNEKIQLQKSLDKIKFDFQKRENYICPIDKNNISRLRTTIYYLNNIEAPIKNNTVIGKARLICEDKILYEIDIFLVNQIDRIDLKTYLWLFVKNYITFYSI